MDKPVVIFDLDGVLINSIPVQFDTYRKLFRKFGIDYGFNEFLQKDITAGSMNVIPRVLKEHGKSINLKAALKEKNYTMKKGRAPLNKGVKKLLQALKKQGFRMAVASGGTMVFVHHILKRHGIYEYFESILTGDDGVRKKPFPDIYLKTARIMKVRPGDCVVVEDSRDGVLAAKRAGMKVIGHRVVMEKQDVSGADAIVPGMEKITPDMIKETWKSTRKKTTDGGYKAYTYFELVVIELMAILNFSRYIITNDIFGFLFNFGATFILVYFAINRNVCPPGRPRNKRLN